MSELDNLNKHFGTPYEKPWISKLFDRAVDTVDNCRKKLAAKEKESKKNKHPDIQEPKEDTLYLGEQLRPSYPTR